VKNLFAILLLLCLPVYAADTIITATLTVTNYPSTNGWQLTLNGSDTRTITNAFTATTIASNSSIGGIATNIYKHLLTNRFNSQRVVSMPATNQVKIVFDTGATASFAQTSNWLSFAYTTNSVSNSYTVRWPISYEPSLATRSNVVNDILSNIYLLGVYTLPANTAALSNHVSRTGYGQAVSGSLVFTGTNTFHAKDSTWSNGYILGATNYGGMISNAGANQFTGTNTVANEVVTNLTVATKATIYNATVTGSLQAFSNDLTQVQIGTNAHAAGASAMAIGAGALASGDTSIAIGYTSAAIAQDAIAIGLNAEANTNNGVAIGSGAVVSSNSGVAIGYGAQSLHASSTAIGVSATTTEANQIRIGTANQKISTAGAIYAADNIVIGGDKSFAVPASLAKAFYATNGTASASDPTNASYLLSVNGGWQYRGSATDGGSGGNRMLHNAGAETNGSGTDYSLTASTAAVDFGGVDPQLTLPTAGTYLIIASAIFNGANANDSLVFKLRDFTASADVANASQTVTAHSTGNSQINIQSIYTVTGSSRIDFYAHNATAARGTVISTLTKLMYVRLY